MDEPKEITRRVETVNEWLIEATKNMSQEQAMDFLWDCLGLYKKHRDAPVEEFPPEEANPWGSSLYVEPVVFEPEP